MKDRNKMSDSSKTVRHLYSIVFKMKTEFRKQVILSFQFFIVIKGF